MTRAERERKRAKENLYYARVTAYIFAVFFGTFAVHLMGCANRGSHGFGGEILMPVLGVAMFYVVKYCSKVKKGE